MSLTDRDALSGTQSFASRDLGRRSSAPRLRRWGWLAISVAVNLILIGLILAWVINMPGHPPSASWQLEIIPSLSPADAAIVADSVHQTSDARVNGDQVSHEQWGKVHDILEKEPLNGEALIALMSEMGQIRIDQQTAMGQIFLSELTRLSPDGRAKLLVLMKRQWNRWKPPPR